MSTEVRVTDWCPFPDDPAGLVTACRIWLRRSPFGHIQQRHEWKRPDGSAYFEHDWLDTPSRDFPAGARPTEALQIEESA